MSKTFDLDIDNTSDHQPVIAKLDYSIPDVLHGQHCPNSTTKQKIHWSNISQETVNTLYNVCSVHRGMFSTSGGVQYIRGIP